MHQVTSVSSDKKKKSLDPHGFVLHLGASAGGILGCCVVGVSEMFIFEVTYLEVVFRGTQLSN